jgi:microcompartment protein CcmL/EutN
MRLKPALGVIETCGMPAAIITADILEKAADVRVTGLENTDAGRISVIIQGQTGAVQAAIKMAIATLRNHSGVIVLGHHIIPCPDASTGVMSLLRRSLQGMADHSVEWLDD